MRIGINCGHTKTGPGSGAIGFINESIESRNVGNALIQLLQDAGHTVVNCTVDSASTQSAYLQKSVELANVQKLDLFVSIHFNAGGGKGVEVYTYGGKSFDEAEKTCKNISAYGFSNRGIKDGSNLYVIRKTSAKAMLIEVCFVDNENDCNNYKNIGYMNIARAIFNGIIGKGANVMSNQSIFSDVSINDSAYNDIKKLKDYGIINGYGDGTFRPDQPITRKEAAVIISRALSILGK